MLPVSDAALTKIGDTNASDETKQRDIGNIIFFDLIYKIITPFTANENYPNHQEIRLKY